jgi:outer membrane protein assembly factor BamE (lipoprotein component of BamABCDE complex)
MKSTLAGILATTVASTLVCGCMTASEHRADVSNPTGDKLTVGTVQKEIRVGMSGAEVATVLGSPNIVSTDEQRREVWIYDKISTDVAYSTSSGGISALILGGGSNVGGGIGGSGGRSAGAASTSQKTLTVIIKFDDDKKVRDFAYHTSSF